jgi:hypothetical protein
MKKLLYILGFMMFFSAVLQPLAAHGDEAFSEKEEDVPFSSARIFSKLVDAVGLDPNADWTESFGEEDIEDVGKDMYLVIYNKILNEPVQQTHKDIAGKYGMNQGDLWLVMNGDYTPIVDRKPGLTQEELQEKVTEIQGEYREMRDIEELKANINAAVVPSEMFANGDLSDSGFDLINDLQIIEKILFLESDPVDIGKSYTSATSDGLAQVGQAPTTPGEVTAPSGLTTPPVSSTIIGGGTETISPTRARTGASQFPRSGQFDGFNPNVCFEDEDYSDALSEFQEKSMTDDNYKDGSEGQVPYSGKGTGGPTTDFKDQETEDTGQAGGQSDFFPPAPPDLTPIPSAEPDDWLKNRLCAGFFCLEINFAKAPAKSAFANSDNCIACHVEKINEVLKTVIDHSLVPTKAPGNLGESAECKGAMLTALGSFHMNVYAVGMPVKTPINDDLMFGTSIIEEWANYCNQVAFFPTEACESVEEKAKHEYKIPPSLVDRATEHAFSVSPDVVTQEQMSRRISDTIAGYEIDQSGAIRAYNTESSTAENAVFFHPLMYELDQMNYLFSNIRSTLESLHEGDGDACFELKNKNECE